MWDHPVIDISRGRQLMALVRAEKVNEIYQKIDKRAYHSTTFDTYHHGFLFEQVLCNYFVHKAGEHHPPLTKSDAGDIKLYMRTGIEMVFDAKVTAIKMVGMEYMILTKSQFDPHFERDGCERPKPDYYIAGRMLNPTRFMILGYFHRLQLEPVEGRRIKGISDNSLLMPLERLLPISDVFNNALPGEFSERYPSELMQRLQAKIEQSMHPFQA